MKFTFLKISLGFLIMAGAGSVFPRNSATIPVPDLPQQAQALAANDKSGERSKPPPLPAFPSTYEGEVHLAQSQPDSAKSESLNPLIEPGDLNNSEDRTATNLLTLASRSTKTSEAAQAQSTLVVPKLELQNPIVSVPLVDGYWSVDDLGSEVGMLEGVGRFPQDEQSMVFAGHVTTFWPIGGPFAYLDRLLPKDEVIYIYENQKYVYEVTRLLYVEPNQVNHLLNDNGDQIILVTCGQYNVLQGDFEKRLLVIADLIDIQPIPFN
ncbi:MAG: sortase [Anaerolineae bacterium]